MCEQILHTDPYNLPKSSITTGVVQRTVYELIDTPAHRHFTKARLVVPFKRMTMLI